MVVTESSCVQVEIFQLLMNSGKRLNFIVWNLYDISQWNTFLLEVGHDLVEGGITLSVCLRVWAGIIGSSELIFTRTMLNLQSWEDDMETSEIYLSIVK